MIEDKVEIEEIIRGGEEVMMVKEKETTEDKKVIDTDLYHRVYDRKSID